MAKVIVESCGDYEPQTVLRCVRKAVDQLGGMRSYINPGDKVLIKPNLIIRRRPEEATTTHPAVVAAVTALVLEAGGVVTIADSPGGPYTPTLLKGLYASCGMARVAEEYGVKLNLETGFETVSYHDGRVCKSFDIIRPAVEADKIITVSKLKTHVMSYMTGCVKNLFGIVPGTYKAEYHFRMPDKKLFSDMLVDLCGYASPVLSIMDAIDGMEGDGPTSGQPRHIGKLLAGANPHEVDYTAAALIGIDQNLVYTLKNAMERKLLTPREIQVLGEFTPLTDFKKASVRDIHFAAKHPLRKVLDSIVNPKPTPDKYKCIACGKCMEICPAKVIKMQQRLPRITYQSCIRCFCCHEMCPVKAMDIRRPILWNIIVKYLD